MFLVIIKPFFSPENWNGDSPTCWIITFITLLCSILVECLSILLGIWLNPGALLSLVVLIISLGSFWNDVAYFVLNIFLIMLIDSALYLQAVEFSALNVLVGSITILPKVECVIFYWITCWLCSVTVTVLFFYVLFFTESCGLLCYVSPGARCKSVVDIVL